MRELPSEAACDVIVITDLVVLTLEFLLAYMTVRCLLEIILVSCMHEESLIIPEDG